MTDLKIGDIKMPEREAYPVGFGGFRRTVTRTPRNHASIVGAIHESPARRS